VGAAAPQPNADHRDSNWLVSHPLPHNPRFYPPLPILMNKPRRRGTAKAIFETRFKVSLLGVSYTSTMLLVFCESLAELCRYFDPDVTAQSRQRHSRCPGNSDISVSPRFPPY
jgi:hypothetical protein